MSADSMWFYARNGRPFGPVPLSVLQELIRRRELLPGDLVWTEGMPSWAPVQSVFPVDTSSSTGTAVGPPLPYTRVSATSPQRRLARVAIFLGVLAFGCLPMIFGVVGILCAAIALTIDGPDRRLAWWGLGVSVAGTVLGTLGSCLLLGLG